MLGKYSNPLSHLPNPAFEFADLRGLWSLHGQEVLVEKI